MATRKSLEKDFISMHTLRLERLLLIKESMSAREADAKSTSEQGQDKGTEVKSFLLCLYGMLIRSNQYNY